MFEKSLQLYERFRKVEPGGVTSSVRLLKTLGHPIYWKSGKGSRITDIDGNEYIDFCLAHGAALLGHGHPKVMEAIRKAIEIGAVCSTETEINGMLAEKISQIVPAAEMVRFTCSGTEATMHCIRVARGYTGRIKLLKFEGHFHGFHDDVLISYMPPIARAGPPEAPIGYPESAGIPPQKLETTIVIPFNDVHVLEKTITKNRDELAAVICEPINYNSGCIIPSRDYMKAMRELTQENDIPLIFDEVLSSFRMCPGGGQEYLGVTPDLCTLGKAIANGAAPLSAFAGKEEYMKHVAPLGGVLHSGTYNGHQLSVAAGLACMEEIMRPGFYDRIDKLGQRLYKGLAEVFEDLGLIVRVQGLGARFGIYFGVDQEVTNYREAAKSDPEMFAKFQTALMMNGVFFFPYWGKPCHHGFSSAHTEEDIDEALSRIAQALKEKPIKAR
jgi:glutamate-1-semialdehyde 2,1-aminomutase